jgi:peptide methionine sulfoxide reductase MsrA
MGNSTASNIVSYALEISDRCGAGPLTSRNDWTCGVVEVVYDPSKITYGQLLRIFFSVAHDPTQLNWEGPDVGTSYRSAIFYVNDDQKRIANA